MFKVSTVVGKNGKEGRHDGPADEAIISEPHGITIDNKGTIYVSCKFDIIKLEDGMVTTIACIQDSMGIAIDPNSNILVGSREVLFEIPKGENFAKLLAGQRGYNGNFDGSYDEAQFHCIINLCVDLQGTIFAVDYFGNAIRKLCKGKVTTVDTKGLLSSPVGIAIDIEGNMFIGDQGNYCIRKLDKKGEMSVVAGCPGVSGNKDGRGIDALFGEIGGIALDHNHNLIVVDSEFHVVKRISCNGDVTTIAGAPQEPGEAFSVDGLGPDARFRSPACVAVDSMGDIFVTCERDVNSIRKITQVPWEAANHFLFPENVRTQVRTMMKMQGNRLNWIPKDVVLIICKYIAT